MEPDLHQKPQGVSCAVAARFPQLSKTSTEFSHRKRHCGGVAVDFRTSRTALLFAAWVFLSGPFAPAQIAPGPLSPAHAPLNGIIKCASCHELLGSGLKCLGCHTEIKSRIEAGSGYHARVLNQSAGPADCARCHAEHRGPGFAFVPLNRKVFNHGALTGFALEGTHSEQKCEACHSAARVDAAARSEIKLKDLNRSFLGLRRECTFCHEEPHQGRLGTNCLSCHTPDNWSPASRFSHSRAQFQLTGLHQKVPCEKCHAGGNADAAAPNKTSSTGISQRKLLFKGLRFDGCNNCHEDRHRGAFSGSAAKCEQCHDTSGFRSSGLARAFDHGLTGFRLIGRHAEMPCDKCHKPDRRGLGSANRCAGCHEDPHKGQFASSTGPLDCSACHNATGFKPSLYNRAAHSPREFPLTGKHSTLPCDNCHRPEMRTIARGSAKALCSECHSDTHDEDFESEPYNNRCGQCHPEAGANAAAFTVERHSQTRFSLIGRHAGVDCRKCHAVPSIAGGAAPVMAKASFSADSSFKDQRIAPPGTRLQFRFASLTCSGCHTDPHGVNAENLTCETCHTSEGWSSVLPFDHSRLQINLEGAHREAADKQACTKCHAARSVGDGIKAAKAPVFSGISMQCAGCHADKEPHGGQFNISENESKDCSSCHTPGAWNALSFDHSRTRFTLSGAHRSLSCAKCHKEQSDSDGKIVRLYRDTPFDCLNCH